MKLLSCLPWTSDRTIRPLLTPHMIRNFGNADLVTVVGQANARELPTRRRVEEVAVAFACVAEWRRVRRAPQHHLVDHELAIIFAERARRRPITRIGRVRAASPLPYDAKGIVDETKPRRHLPLGFGRQILARPAREGI